MSPKTTPRISLEEIKNNQLGLDDTFEFGCEGCGDCCRNREDIMLTPYDMYRVSKCTRTKPVIFFQKYCETYLGPDSKTPIIRLLPKKPTGLSHRQREVIKTVCPLLRDGKCIVHKLKPVVCAIFPLGRCYAAGAVIKGQDISYFRQGQTCGNMSKTQTVRQWLKKFNVPEDNDFMNTWGAFLQDFWQFIKSTMKELPDEQRAAIYAEFLFVLFFKYDTNKEFMPQLESNIVQFKEIMSAATISLLNKDTNVK